MSSIDRSPRTSCLAVILVVLCAPASTATGQTTPGDHAAHHPNSAPDGETPAKESGGSRQGGKGGMMGGGTGGGMGAMMEKMGAPKPKEIYPRLMGLPDLPTAERAKIEAEAHRRMIDAATLLGAGLDELSAAASDDDFATMQDATAKMGEGLAWFESGLAAQRAIAEGKAPRNVALQWFKREMSLLPPAGSERRFLLWGMDAFHAAVMAALVVFTASMIWMYYFKMRRAAALLERLTAEASAAGPAATSPAAGVAAASRLRETPGGRSAAPQPSTGPERAEVATGAAGSPSKAKPARWSGTLRVACLFEETPDVSTFRLVHPAGNAIPFTFLPGQFLAVTVTPDDKPVKRSYTIASSPSQRDYVELTVKREPKGLVSRYLHDHVKPGNELSIVAPSGYFTFTGADTDSIVLVAGGVGITPMMSTVRYLTDRGWQGDIFLLFCCRAPADYIFRDELAALQRRHARLHVAVTMTRADESAWSGPRGRLSKELINETVPSIASRRIHICGPRQMMDAATALLVELGVPDDQIKTENFGQSGAAKAKPALDSPPAPADAATAWPTATFCHSTKTGPLPPDQSILDVADALDVEIDNSCRSGTCGMCKVKLLEGSVTMECDDALEPEEKADGIILACQAKSTGNVVVEA